MPHEVMSDTLKRVAHAIVTGVLDRGAVPAEVLDHVAGMIRFYESEEGEAARDE